MNLSEQKEIIKKIENISLGSTKDEVQKLLGVVSEMNSEEWMYNLDENSGYIILFSNDRVKKIQSWKS